MLHVLLGEDDYSRRQALEEIKQAIGDPAALMSNTTALDGRTVTPELLSNACNTVPFLAEKRLIIVEGLLARFEPAGKAARKKSSRQTGPPEETKRIIDIILTLPPFTELVFVDGVIKASNPLFSELLKITKVKSFPLLPASQVSDWVERRAQAAGGNISPQAVKTLVRFVGNDLWTMANEVDKLVLYAAGRRIEEADIKALVSYVREENVFAMVDAVLEFRGSVAQDILQQLLRGGAEPVYLLVMLSRQVRIIFLTKEMRARGKFRSEIQHKLGLTSDFLLRKAWEQSEKYPAARLRGLYHRLLETDISIKTGRLEGEIALNILISELGQKGIVSV